MRGGVLTAGCFGVALLVLYRRRASEPLEPPVTRVWDDTRGARLRFPVGQRRPAAANSNATAGARATQSDGTRGPLAARPSNATATRCHLDGTQTDGGCNGHACLLGACFCSGGVGGEWCERPAVTPSCADEARKAYDPLATALKRHAPLDACAFYSAPYGTLAVDERRWAAAQEWEAALWSASAAGVTTDRNEHHKKQFENYAELPERLGHVVEVGCGPFTQLQTILQHRSRVESITLVDPLIERYAAEVRGCPYGRSKLAGKPVARVAARLEELALPVRADVLVMVSVLQSVRDVPRAMQAAYDVLRPGGVIVFADRAFDERWEAYHRSGRAEARVFWDVGHPCAVKLAVLEHFMAAFRELYRKRHVQPSTHGGPPDEQVYFIGRKPRGRRAATRWAARLRANQTLPPNG